MLPTNGSNFIYINSLQKYVGLNLPIFGALLFFLCRKLVDHANKKARTASAGIEWPVYSAIPYWPRG